MSDQHVQHDSESSAIKKLMTAQQVAELLKVDPSWVYAETRAGRFPHVRLGRYRRASALHQESAASGSIQAR